MSPAIYEQDKKVFNFPLPLSYGIDPPSRSQVVGDKRKDNMRTIKDARKLGVMIHVKLPSGIKPLITSKKSKVLNHLARTTEKQWLKGVDVKVRYQKRVENSATLHGLKDVKDILRVWFEPDLVDYCTMGEW